jgi:hypothetical protein
MAASDPIAQDLATVRTERLRTSHTAGTASIGTHPAAQAWLTLPLAFSAWLGIDLLCWCDAASIY